jgi:ABC-type amino acid transport system permease subunit
MIVRGRETSLRLLSSDMVRVSVVVAALVVWLPLLAQNFVWGQPAVFELPAAGRMVRIGVTWRF